MKELFIDSFKDALFDTVKLIPFLLITYVVMEWLERKTAGRQAHVLGKAEKLGPLIGGVLGIVPQCGFSLMASNLYSGGVIGAGVLIAVFMSTSDTQFREQELWLQRRKRIKAAARPAPTEPAGAAAMADRQ